MRLFSLIAPVALVTALAAPALAQTTAAAAPFPGPKALPAAKTLAYVEVMDWYQADAALKTTDFGQALNLLKPFMDKVWAGLETALAQQKQQFADQMGVSADDVETLLKSGFALGVVNMAPAGGQPQPQPVLIFSRQAKMMVSGMLDAMKKKQGENAPPLFVVEREGVVCVCMDQNAVAAADGSSGPTLDADAGFQSLRAKVTAQQAPIMHLYYNVAAAIQMAGGDKQVTDALDKLGLTNVKGVAIGLVADGGRIRETLAVAAPGERKGLFAILAGMPAVDVSKLAETVPDGCIGFSAARMNARAVYDALLDICKGLNPQDAQRIDRAIADFEQELGMKVRDDILDGFGDTMTAETWMPEDGFMPESCFAFTVKDAGKVQRMLGEFAHRAGLDVQTTTRGGKKVSYLLPTLGNFGDNPVGPQAQEQAIAQGIMDGIFGAWTIDGGKIYFAQMPQIIEDRFERMAAGTSLAENEEFKKAVAKAPKGGFSFGWQKERGIMGFAYNLVEVLLKGVEPYARRAGIDVDTALLPRASQFAKPFKASTSTIFVDQDGLSLVMQGGAPVLTTIPILAAMAGPAFLMGRQARPAGNDVRNDLRMVAMAEMMWKEDKAAYTANLQDLIQAGQIDAQLPERVMRAGYQLKIEAPQTGGFRVIAQPFAAGKAGYEVDEQMDVRPLGARPRATPA
jgi:hypothetical protein